MGLLTWLGLASERAVSQRVIIEYATVKSKRVEPVHEELLVPPLFPLASGELFGTNWSYAQIPVSVPEQYELSLEGDVHGAFTYRCERDEFHRVFESLAIGDRVEVSYIPRVLNSDTIVSVQKARQASVP